MGQETLHKGSGYAWAVLVGAFMMSASMGIYISIGQLFPAISGELNVNVGLLAMSMMFCSIGMTISAFLSGALMQKIDIRALLTVCSVVTMGAIAAISLSSQLWHLYALCIVMGLFAAPVFIVGAPVLVENWFAQKKGLAMGLVMAGAGVGSAVFNMLGAILVSSAGWRTTLVILGVIGLVMTVPFTLFVIRLTPADKGLKPYGFDLKDAKTPDAAKAQAKGMSASSAYKTVAFWALFIGIGLSSVVNTYSAILPSYADALGSPNLMGPIGVAFALGGCVFPLIMGPLADKLGNVASIVINSAIIIVGFLGMLAGVSSAAILLAGAFLGANANTIGRVLPPLLASQAFGAKDYMKIIGTLNAGMSLFGMLGSLITSSLLAVTGSFELVFGFGVGVGIAILALFLLFNATSKGLAAKWSE